MGALKKNLLFSFLFIICMVITGFPVTAFGASSDKWPEGPDIDCLSACVINIDTGTVLYEKDMDMVNYPASITKILTAKLALENSELDEVVTFSEDAVYKNEGDTSHIWRDIGEEMTMEQCLYGMMLASANECAWAIGEHVSGNIESFVDLMNKTAEKLGCKNTHFNNPNGLPDENHYTSAHDMALIAASAYKNETFRMICSTKTYTIPETNKHDEPTYLANHHKILFAYQGDSSYVRDYCTGGKTGYTVASGSTLVTYGEKNGMKLACVVMNGKSPSHYTDTIKLMEYCFDNFVVYRIADSIGDEEGDVHDRSYLDDSETDFAKIDDSGVFILPVGVDPSAVKVTTSYKESSKDTDVIGVQKYKYAGKKVGSANIRMTGVAIDVDISDREGGADTGGISMLVEEEEEEEEVVSESIFDNIKSLFIKEDDGETNTLQIKLTPWLIVIVVGVIVLIVLLVILIRFLASHMYIIRRRRAERKAEKEKTKGLTFVSGKKNKWGRGGGLHF